MSASKVVTATALAAARAASSPQRAEAHSWKVSSTGAVRGRQGEDMRIMPAGGSAFSLPRRMKASRASRNRGRPDCPVKPRSLSHAQCGPSA